MQRTVHDPDTIFRDDVDDILCPARFRGAPRAEYIMLVRRQCRARKVGLMHNCRHAAAVFAVSKKGTGESGMEETLADIRCLPHSFLS